MENTPQFRIGDYVRIMQTSEMERRGIANQHGKINWIIPGSDNTEEQARVELMSGKIIAVPTSALMRKQR